eukprot:3378543-Rhodomonas_salina.2
MSWIRCDPPAHLLPPNTYADFNHDYFVRSKRRVGVKFQERLACRGKEGSGCRGFRSRRVQGLGQGGSIGAVMP